MQTLVIYPGTFDPITKGHLDLIRRSCEHFSQIIVAVAQDTHKQALFTAAERMEMIKLSVNSLPHRERVSVEVFNGLLVEYMKSRKANIALRGLRAISDFEYEFQLAQMNRKLYAEFEIIYMMPDERYTYISSSLVKEVAALGGDIREFVTDEVAAMVRNKMASNT